MPAAATSAAMAAWSAGESMPRLTQWLAVAPRSNPDCRTSAAKSRRSSRWGSSVSSVWRSMGRPVSAATCEAGFEAAERVRVDVRAAAHDVGTRVHGVTQPGPLLGSLGAAHGWRDEGHHLEVEAAGERLADRGQCLDAAQADVRRDIDVGADRGGPVGQQQQGSPGGPLDHVVDAERGPEVGPGGDGAGQVVGRVLDPVGGQRLVEVGVRLGRRRQQEVAARGRARPRPRGRRATGRCRR